MRVSLHSGWVDLDTGRGTVADREVQLTSTERRFLEIISSRPGEILGYDRLTEAVWDARPGTKDRAIESLLRRLRVKLGESARDPVHLFVEHGQGIRFLPASAAPGRRAWAGAVWAGPAATAWLEERLPAGVPAHEVYAWAGGAVEVLERVVELGVALSADALRDADPLDLPLPGGAPVARLEQAAAAGTALALQVAESLVPVGPAGIQRTELAKLCGVPLLALLPPVAELAESGWIWLERDRLGLDPLVRRWLRRRFDPSGVHEAHLRWVESMDATTQRRYWSELVLAARRAPERIRGPMDPTALVRTCGGSDETEVDDALIEVARALAAERPDDARRLFAAIPEPGTPLARFRWGNFGGQVAITCGDLERGAALAHVCQVVAASLGPGVVAQAAHMVDEIDHRLGRATGAFAVLPTTGATDLVHHFYTTMTLWRRFECTPTEALAARYAEQIAVFEGTRPHARLVLYQMCMEAELGRLPSTLDMDHALERLVESFPPTWYLRDSAYKLALACLPDAQAAFDAWRRAPPDPISFLTRLEDATLQRVLFDDPAPLRDGGFGALGKIVADAADGGRISRAEAGAAWRLVDHLRRAAVIR